MMRHIDASRGWILLIGVLALGGTSLGSSCLIVNRGHCRFRGGDLACREGEDRGFCVSAVEGRLHGISADENGCVPTLPDECEQSEVIGCVHVAYGLPVALRMEDLTDPGMDPTVDTVEGLVQSILGSDFDGTSAACEAALGEIDDARLNALRGVRQEALAKDRETASASKLAFSLADKDTILRFNDLVGPLLTACSTDEDDTTGTTTDEDTTATESGETVTTGEPICTGPEDCLELPMRPICSMGGMCVGCHEAGDSAACTAQLPNTPACVMDGDDTGACVLCTADDDAACMNPTPVCDEATHTCVACYAHEQCGEAACNLFTGACLPPDRVVHVGPGQEFTTLADAMGSIEPNTEGTIIVHPGPLEYNEAVTVGGGRVVAFLAADLGPGVDPPRWIRGSGDTPQLTVAAGTTVLMDGLQLTGNLSSMVPGVRINGGDAWIDRSRIVQNAGGGIVVQSNSVLVLRNSFVGGNGGGGVDSVGIDVINAQVRVLYSTVARNDEATIDSIRCSGGTVDVRNSIVVGRDPDSIDCRGISITNSALDEDIDTEIPLEEGGNMNVGAANLAWFVAATGGDFHLTPLGATVFADIAQWTPGEPPTDIDGQPRPTTMSSDYAGADVP